MLSYRALQIRGCRGRGPPVLKCSSGVLTGEVVGGEGGAVEMFELRVRPPWIARTPATPEGDGGVVKSAWRMRVSAAPWRRLSRGGALPRVLDEGLSWGVDRCQWARTWSSRCGGGPMCSSVPSAFDARAGRGGMLSIRRQARASRPVGMPRHLEMAVTEYVRSSLWALIRMGCSRLGSRRRW